VIPDPLDISPLQHALHHLYDPAVLKRSPLAQFLGIPAGEQATAALRRALIEAIQSLRPPASLPQSSKAWRIFHILTYRFIEQSSQKEVANEMSLGIRQLRRLEVQALEALAESLAARRVSTAPLPEAAHAAAHPPQVAPGTEQELELLGRTAQAEQFELQALIDGILHTVEPLTQPLGVRITFNPQPPQPCAYGLAVPVRQAVINVLSALAQRIPGGKIELGLESEEQAVSLWITAEPALGAAPVDETQIFEPLALSSRLIALAGGSIHICHLPADSPSLALQISLPCPHLKTILALDDNLDALRLFERYLAGSAYRLSALQDPARLVPLAEQLHPDLILLDVMLPGSDGWELLGRLREHPQLNKIPVIVSTILAQEPLALALGAAAYLRKPVSQEDFLQVVDRLLGAHRATGSQ
jgi:CheY-like chemotaxis protein